MRGYGQGQPAETPEHRAGDEARADHTVGVHLREGGRLHPEHHHSRRSADGARARPDRQGCGREPVPQEREEV